MSQVAKRPFSCSAHAWNPNANGLLGPSSNPGLGRSLVGSGTGWPVYIKLEIFEHQLLGLRIGAAWSEALTKDLKILSLQVGCRSSTRMAVQQKFS